MLNIIIITDESHFGVLKYSILLKLVPMLNLYGKFDQILKVKNKKIYWISYIKLILFMIALTHILALLWYSFAQYQMDTLGSYDTWIQKWSLVDAPWYQLYIFALYYGQLLIMNQAIAPTSVGETASFIVTKFITCGLFAYTVSCIQKILVEIGKNHENFEKELEAINRYMKNYNISSDTRMKVREYMYYMQQFEHNSDQQFEKKVVSKLPLNLQEEIAEEIDQHVIKKFGFLMKHFSKQTAQKVPKIIKKISYTPEQYIYNQFDGKAENLDSNIYFLKYGEVELNTEQSNNKFGYRVLEAGSYFGQYQFYTGQPQFGFAKTKTHCTLLYIERQDFINIVNQKKSDHQMFCYIKDLLLLDQQFKKVGLACEVCKQSNHLT